mmetsp:Transcript_13754/g.23870  ORF Transcript_13754/g.23870 Transcript_13754/m.23870 type:complete len:435 (-) Transcript_13754:1587-2891(-)
MTIQSKVTQNHYSGCTCLRIVFPLILAISFYDVANYVWWCEGAFSVSSSSASRTRTRASTTAALFANRNSDDFLSDRVSSPERYAEALNMTVQQVAERKEKYRQALEQLHQQLLQVEKDYRQTTTTATQSPSAFVGTQKHRLICQHRFRYGHHPFVCPACWSYLPVCVCDHNNRQASMPSSKLEVIVWFHHKEWGLTSNTGGLLKLALGQDKCKLLMKGLPEHDELLQQEYLDNHPRGNLVVVLWPANDGKQSKAKERQAFRITDASDKPQDNEGSGRSPAGITTFDSTSGVATITLDDIRQELASPNGRKVVLMAVDGTWRNARRMVARVPPTIPRLDLPLSVVSEQFSASKSSSSSSSIPSTSTSLLAPLRSKGPSNQRRDGGENLVCTAEAVSMVLVELGIETKDADSILDLARQKVDLVRRYRGHESKVK